MFSDDPRSSADQFCNFCEAQLRFLDELRYVATLLIRPPFENAGDVAKPEVWRDLLPVVVYESRYLVDGLFFLSNDFRPSVLKVLWGLLRFGEQHKCSEAAVALYHNPFFKSRV